MWFSHSRREYVIIARANTSPHLLRWISWYHWLSFDCQQCTVLIQRLPKLNWNKLSFYTRAEHAQHWKLRSWIELTRNYTWKGWIRAQFYWPDNNVYFIFQCWRWELFWPSFNWIRSQFPRIFNMIFQFRFCITIALRSNLNIYAF